MKAWRVYLVDDPDVGVWVHAETRGQAKSAALWFDWFSDHDWDTYLYLRAKQVPELDDKPLTMANLKAIGSFLVDYDEESEPSTEADWPIECRCEMCQAEEKARRQRCSR